MDCFVAALLAMAARHSFAISPNAFFARYSFIPALSELRAQGMPGARCARGLVCNGSGRAHTSIQVTPESPGIPHAMVLTATPCSPRCSGSLATVTPEKLASQELDTSVEVSGPHDFARPLQALSSRALSASTASCPALVTLANAPQVGQDGCEYSADLRFGKPEYFFAMGWTRWANQCMGRQAICPSGSRSLQRSTVASSRIHKGTFCCSALHSQARFGCGS